MSIEGKAYLPQLTGIRFFAAYLVVCHHFLAIPPNRFLNPFLVAAGDIAVSLFFVLSGFVLTLSNRNEGGGLTKGRADYLVARAARIYPQYLLAFLLTAPFFIGDTLAKHPAVHEALPRLLANGLAYLSMLQSWVPGLANAWNGPAWSLSDEAFFYVCFLWLAPPAPRKLFGWFAIAAIAVIAPVVFSRALLAAEGQNFWYFFPPFRLGEFMLGMGIAQIFRLGLVSEWLKPFAGSIFVACMAALVAAMVFLGPVGIRIASTVLLPVALLSLASSGGLIARMLSARGLVLLGDASYGLYLIQVPMFRIYSEIIGESPVWGMNFIGYSLFTIGISVLVHLYVEMPAARLIKRRWRLRRAVAGN